MKEFSATTGNQGHTEGGNAASEENIDEEKPVLPFDAERIVQLDVEIKDYLKDEESESVCDFILEDNQDLVEHREIFLEYINFIAKNMSGASTSDGAVALPEILDFTLKSAIVEWILSKKPVPNKMQLKRNFGSMEAEKMEMFKTCATDKVVITFTMD